MAVIVLWADSEYRGFVATLVTMRRVVYPLSLTVRLPAGSESEDRGQS
jgi:hypothetical protein